MTSAELAAMCLAIWGHNWQGPLARALKVNDRTVRRWASGDVPIPDSVESDIRRILGADERVETHWPRDEWIVQREEGRRMYVVHTITPRFIARAVECDEDGSSVPEEGEADVLTGVVYASGDLVLCEVAWIDAPPGLNEIRQIMDQAADALEDE